MSDTTRKIPRHSQRVLEMAASDLQLQELMPDQAVLDAVCQPGLLLEQVIETTLTGYPSRPVLGERDYDVVIESSAGRRVRQLRPSFSTITYGELHRRVKGLVNAWRHHDRFRVDEGDFVCILGFAGIDYMTMDLALAYQRCVSVPIQTTLAGADLDGIFADTAPTAVAARMSDLVAAARFAGSHRSIRSIIAMDYDERVDDDRDAIAAARLELEQTGSAAAFVTLRELIAAGESDEWELLPVTDDTKNRMALLVHSSGSTGTPKGAIITDKDSTYLYQMVPPAPVPVIRLCFAPLSHLMGRGQINNVMARGGTVYFTAKSDMTTLFDDFRLVRPTDAAMFPRVLDMIHHHFLGEVARRAADGRAIESIRATVMEEMGRSFLGDRLTLMTSGAAPITPELDRFITECFQVPLVDAYGNTEAGGSITIRNRITRPPVIDYKLRDVPELGYYSTDKPYPRGELVVKTQRSIPGYFKRPEATAALFDDEGYLRTGDIMEERGPDHVVYIDRRNDVLKLAQGEFVTCGAVGNVFENGSDVIAQIYVYGNSARSFLVAVVVPNMDIVRDRLGAEPDAEAIRSLIRSELKAVGTAENLRSFEIPRDFIVEMEPFSHENGLLSSVHKRMRPNLQRRYGDALEQLYADLEARQNDELMALRITGNDVPVIAKVGKALEATLGIVDLDLTQPFSFAELGGDSLGATALAALLTDIFGVDVPVGSILSPAGNARQWADQIETALGGGGGHTTQKTFAQVHGSGARELHGRDVDIANFFEPGAFDGAPMDAPPVESKAVLLTGATGFLGRFLCLEWLERLAAKGGTLFCLVRGADQRGATDRLRAAFSDDEELLARFDALAAGHLEVLAGDVADARLGLDDALYARLAGEVDRIVHPAALVNHVLDYEHLFGPNVAGTAELVKLALSERQKRFDFVSSLAVTSLVERSGGNDEHSALRQAVVLTGEYSTGYGATKWASEHLLHSAHRRFGLPVNVFRGDMMLPHSMYHGQINAPDIFIRLLFSLVTTGLAPKSFYELEPDGSRATAHYDGLPVDFVAGAVAAVGAQPDDRISTFNMINHHADGISLDTIVDWVETAGYPLQRVPSHRDWLERFEARLTSMAEQQRQHSSLLVLDVVRKPYSARASAVGSAEFIDAIRTSSIGPEIPHLSEAFIHKCLDDMRRHDLIPGPVALSGF
jgi:fatty acid CoA ligase FadD9